MPPDYAKLREQTLGSGLDEEAVTVNTRALIDKVLARYSGEWTTLRELIQNAADASASKVTIRFETSPSATVPAPSSTDPAANLRHVLQHHTLQRLLVSNNGEAFAESDWSRLKRIAEGNPDETKIGAFGVGFYSVFADCESPFVTSGDQTMAFYWKGNSLFTRRGRIPPAQATRDTTFLLDYRSTGSPVPPLLSICQFLSTSLTFVGLEGIELWLDDWNLLSLNKKSAPAVPVTIPSEVNPRTKDGLMKISAVEHQNAQIDAKWLNAVNWDRKQVSQDSTSDVPPTQSLRTFFSRFATAAASAANGTRKALKDEEVLQKQLADEVASLSTASVFLRISTVKVQTMVGKNLAAELERATKKPPPKQTRIAILTSSYDEAAASAMSASGLASSKADDMFASVLPAKNGRIFIGFPTAQTTGLLAHISAPSVIPTVERENIDLNARYVRSWNQEMLRVAGIACRIAYTGSMADLKSRLQSQMASAKSKVPTKEDVDAILPAAIHTCNQYTFQESTPSSQVGSLIEEAFWTCNQKPSIDVLSTRGVLSSGEVRLATEDLSFVSGIPVIPKELQEKASAFVAKIQGYGLLTEMTTRDIKKELEAQAISEVQLIEFLKWAAKKVTLAQLDGAGIRTLFDGTVVTLDETAKTYPSPVLLLGSIENYPAAARIPAELPMSAETIPFTFIKSISKPELESFGWQELQIVPWLRYIINNDKGSLGPDKSITSSPAFAQQILPVISKSWDTLSQSSKTTVTELLSNRTVIPTKLGMRTPSQAYFASVRLFDDLPTVHGLNGVKEKFLAAIGVRKTIELSVVFDRLMSKKDGQKKWSHVDLIKYLLSVRDDIPSEDLKKLRETPMCTAETDNDDPAAPLHRLSDLFEPTEPLRNLGLPVLRWPGYNNTTPEAQFISSLGLRPHPNVPELVSTMSEAAAAGDSKLYEYALRYLIGEFHRNNYRTFSMASIKTPFLPIQGRGLSQLALPGNCFTNDRCSVLGYDILRADLHPNAIILGVGRDPAIMDAADRLLRSAPRKKIDAQVWFAYFAGRINEIGPSGSLAERLGQALIVPIRFENGEKMATKMVSPRSCYLGDAQTYGDIFDFVDFGPEANAFLFKVGAKHEPSASEIAQMLAREPARLLSTLGVERYFKLLRRLADNVNGLKTDKALFAKLKAAPFLLAIRERPKNVRENDAAIYEEETMIQEHVLAAAMNIVAIDDFGSFAVFREHLLSAPQEEILENLYTALGTPWLGKIVEVSQSMGHLSPNQAPAEKLRARIVERCQLFLHDHSADQIRHDAKWMERVLLVKVTTALTLKRALKGYNASNTERKTAALHRDSKSDATLYITPTYDLYEVGRAIMSLMLKRPKPQDFLALETILESTLPRLKMKGYNVDRILRQQAAEKRVAEAERQKQLKEEENRLAAEANGEKSQTALPTPAEATPVTPTTPSPESKEMTLPERFPPMPGAFDASPENGRPQSSKGTKGTFFSKLGKQLGFNNDANGQNSTATESMQSLLGGTRPQSSGQTATSTQAIDDTLSSAIRSARPFGSTSLFHPPQTDQIKEQSTYCDTKPAQDLAYAATTQRGIKLYLPKGMPIEHSRTFLEANNAAIDAFASLLLDVAGIFSLPTSVLHLYFDPRATAIAFNTGGSLFCNIRYFLELHWQRFGVQGGMGKVDAAVYWWMTLCHELAHNLVAEHSAAHGFYTESFATRYFAAMVELGGRYRMAQ